jgi:uncharacterized glyoxalase superfamily protein PhnB
MDDSTNEIGEPFVPPGWHTVTPRITVNDPQGLIKFLEHVFDAAGSYTPDRPSLITIGDSRIMVGEAGIRDVMTAFLYVYVKDVDAAYRRAIDADAQSIENPFDTPYGDRRCMVADKWGNIWQIATYNQAHLSDRQNA